MTKPIELGAKKAEKRSDQQKPAQIEKTPPSKSRREALVSVEQRTEAEIMTLAPPRARKASAKPEIINQIGQCLGRVYNDVLKQPVPDRFLELLQTLETGDAPTMADSTPQAAQSAGGRKKDSK